MKGSPCESPCKRGDVAQLGERLNRTQEVGGSNPLVSTIFIVSTRSPRDC
jgi:hypothetical protein